METNFRSLTLDERFFKEPTIIQVPISVIPGNLPPVLTAPVMPMPAPDLSASQFSSPSLLTTVENFISKNKWTIIIVGIVVIGGTLYLSQKKKEEEVKPAQNDPFL